MVDKCPRGLQAFREDMEAWLIQPMFAVVHNLRTVACQADDEAKRLGRKSDVLENCGRQLVNCFSTASQASGDAPHHFGLLPDF
jgi:hypothetical protein